MEYTKISLSFFKALLDRPDWVREQYVERIDKFHDTRVFWDFDADCTREIEVEFIVCRVLLTSTVADFTISYEQHFSYAMNDPDSLEVHTGDDFTDWVFWDFEVVDNGCSPPASEFEDFMPYRFREFDFNVLHEAINNRVHIVKPHDHDPLYLRKIGIDMCHVRVDYAPDLTFEGRLLGQVSSFPHDRDMLCSVGIRDRWEGDLFVPGKPIRWQELALYKTLDGQYVCAKKACSSEYQEGIYHTATVCKSRLLVTHFFGGSQLANRLYLAAGLLDEANAGQSPAS